MGADFLTLVATAALALEIKEVELPMEANVLIEMTVGRIPDRVIVIAFG